MFDFLKNNDGGKNKKYRHNEVDFAASLGITPTRSDELMQVYIECQDQKYSKVIENLENKMSQNVITTQEFAFILFNFGAIVEKDLNNSKNNNVPVINSDNFEDKIKDLMTKLGADPDISIIDILDVKSGKKIDLDNIPSDHPLYKLKDLFKKKDSEDSSYKDKQKRDLSNDDDLFDNLSANS